MCAARFPNCLARWLLELVRSASLNNKLVQTCAWKPGRREPAVAFFAKRAGGHASVTVRRAGTSPFDKGRIPTATLVGSNHIDTKKLNHFIGRKP